MIGSGGDGGGSSGFSPPERAESFGHVLIDFTDRRYKTKDSRLPGPQWQTIVYSAEVTQIFDDEDAFDEVNIKPFAAPSRSELINWENARATPERGRVADGCKTCRSM